MSIPSNCTVLIIGGGPGGSYTASVLAREGIDSVLLEAERFPRYHIGESMLPSLRYFLRFIGLDGEFDGRGFTEKVGAAFKVAPEIPEGFFDFLAVGPNNYSWNLLRSEADSMLFAHASKSGAKAIDGVRVIDIQFDPAPGSGDIGRPVSAFYKCKGDDGSINTGTIRFDYLVDATGRAGLLSTKYLKSRVYSKALKNIAHWAYYTGAGMYAPGTKRENSPFFEGFGDGSGWAWFIPLHDGTASVGIVRNQEIFFQERKAPRVENGTDLATYYEKALSTAPVITGLLHQTASGSPAQRVSQIHSASDYSYSSTSYSLPYARIVGDAGCFIDPLFSSGFHLALVGGLAAATTIAASIRGNVSEDVAAQWHSRKITASYTRFLLVVLAVYKQIRNQREVVLRAEVNISRPPASSSPADGDLDRALEVLRPVFQGSVDFTNRMTEAESVQIIEILADVLDPRLLKLLEMERGEYQLEPGRTGSDADGEDEDVIEKDVTTALRMAHEAAVFSGGNFSTGVIDGMVPRMERGCLTLVAADSV